MTETIKHLLVLDDEESIRRSIAAFMEDEGYCVYEAASGEDAVDIMKQNPIDQAIVDIRLPGMDGDTFILKAKQIAPKLQVLIHTGSSDYVPSDEVRALGIDNDCILYKPAQDLDEIIVALNKLSPID